MQKRQSLFDSFAKLLARPDGAPCSPCQTTEAQGASPCFLRPGERRLIPRGLEQHQLVCGAEIGSGWDQAESVCLLVGYGGSLLGIIGSGAMARADGVALDALGSDLAFSLFLGELDSSVRALIFVAGGHSTSRRKRRSDQLPTAEGLVEETGVFFLASVTETREEDKLAEHLDHVPCEELCRTDVRLPSRNSLRKGGTAVAVMAIYAGERIGEPFSVHALALPLLLEQRMPLAPLACAGFAQFQAALAYLPGREPLPDYGPRAAGSWLPSPVDWSRNRSWESELVKPTYKRDKNKFLRSSEVLLTALRVAHCRSSAADVEHRRVLQLQRFIGSAQEALQGARSVGQSLVYRMENWRRQALLLQQESRARDVVRLISALPTLSWLEDSLAKVKASGSAMPAGSLLAQGLTTPRTAGDPKLRYGAAGRHSSALPPAVGIGDQPMKTPRDGVTPRGCEPRDLGDRRGSLSSRDLFLRATSAGSTGSSRTFLAEVEKEMPLNAVRMPSLRSANPAAPRTAAGNSPFPEVEIETLPQMTAHPSLEEVSGFAYMEGARRPGGSDDERSNAGYSDSTWASEMDSTRSNLPPAAQGYWAQELQAQQELLRMLENEPRPNIRGIATVLGGMGVALGAMGRHSEARAVLERALRLEEASSGPSSLQAAVARMRLASAHAEEGGDTQRRAELLEGAVNTMDRQLGMASFDFASALMNRGSVQSGYPKLQSEAPAHHGTQPLPLQDSAIGPSTKHWSSLGEVPATGKQPEPRRAFHIPLPVEPPPAGSPLASPSSMVSSPPRSERHSARGSASWEAGEAERIFIEVSKQGDGPTRLVGLELDAKPAGLQVKTVREGIVTEWNSKFPDQQVKAGDWVVEVNGNRGQAEMLHALSSRTNLMIMFERRPPAELEPKALQEPKTLQPSEQEVARQKEPPRQDPRAKRPEPRVEQEAALDAKKQEVEDTPLSTGLGFSHESGGWALEDRRQPAQVTTKAIDDALLLSSGFSREGLGPPGGAMTPVAGSTRIVAGFSGSIGLGPLDELEEARVATPLEEVKEPPPPDSSAAEVMTPALGPQVEEQLTKRKAASQGMPEMPAPFLPRDVPDLASAFRHDDLLAFSRPDRPAREFGGLSHDDDIPLPSPVTSSCDSEDSDAGPAPEDELHGREVVEPRGENVAAAAGSSRMVGMEQPAGLPCRTRTSL